MIDFLATDLIVLVVGLVLLAWFFFKYLENDQQKVVPGFLAVGFIGTLSGLDLIFRWPLSGSYNIAFGGPLLMFGVLLFFAGFSMLKGWDLTTLGVFNVFAGAATIVLGLRMWTLGMTQAPAIAGISYILTGAGGILTLPSYIWRKSMVLRIIVAVLFIIAAVLFAITGYAAFWAHLKDFATWKP